MIENDEPQTLEDSQLLGGGPLGFTDLLKISLQVLIPRSRNNASWHSGMQPRRTQPNEQLRENTLVIDQRPKPQKKKKNPKKTLQFMIVLKANNFQEAGFNLSRTMKENKYLIK